MEILDRIARLARSIVADGEREPADFTAAMAELDDFLRGDRGHWQQSKVHVANAHVADVTPEVTRAYRALELSPAATALEAKRAFRRLVTAYHPDRFASDSEHHRAAGEVTRRLTEAYAVVRRHQLQGGRS